MSAPCRYHCAHDSRQDGRYAMQSAYRKPSDGCLNKQIVTLEPTPMIDSTPNLKSLLANSSLFGMLDEQQLDEVVSSTSSMRANANTCVGKSVV